MVDPHTNGCPEPEVLAAYVDRGLSLTERGRVEAHLASCPQCIRLVAGVVRTVAELSAQMPDVVVTPEATPLVTRRSLAGALTAAAAVLAIVVAPSLLKPWLDRDSGLVSLVDSVGEHRSVLGRLTGGFPHAPLGVPSAGGQGGRAAATDRVQLTAGKTRESFDNLTTPSQLHALGVAQLLDGRYDDAAQSLLAASREQPGNARYLNDVATVQLERARLGLRPDDLPRALAAADRARRLDPSLHEAWFNRALAASALSLNDEARSAWTEYLKRDDASAWAGEAKARLNELNKPTPAAAWVIMQGRLQTTIDASTADEAVRTQTTEARNFIENTLFVNWSAAVLSGGTGAAELERLRTMSAAMLRVAGDAVYSEAVAAIDRATSSVERASLATAHRDYANAAAAFNEDRVAASLPGFREARSRFGGSSFAVLSALHEGAAGFVMGRAGEAESTLTSTAANATGKGYAFAAARANWFLGLMAMGQGRFADGQARYEAALDTFTRMGDVEMAGNMHNLLAALHDYLGDTTTAWQHRLIAFEALSASRSPRFKSQVLSTAVPSIRSESPETALAIQDAALAAARESGRAVTVAEILSQRASLLASENRVDEAKATSREAREQMAALTDPSMLSRLEGAVLAVESDLQRHVDPAAAVEAATRAIDIVRRRGDRLRLAQLNLRLAQANIVWGRTGEARIALENGLKAFNEERAARTDFSPISALDESWQLFDAAVHLSLKEKNYPRAFELAESARARSAGESKRFGAVSLSAVQAALAADEAILALNQFDDELAVWVITQHSIDVAMRSMSRQASRRLIARQQYEIWSGAATTTAGRALYNEILRPVARQLTGASRLIVVPDATFQDVSFAALYNPANNRFVVEDMSVRMSPSASAFAATAAITTSSTTTEPLIFNGTAGEAADAVAGAYRSSTVRRGNEATRERLFADAADRRIVHLAGRTSANASYPLLSRLVVADEPGARYSGEILGRDFVQRTLPRTGLVVLDTIGTTNVNRGEGTSGLTRAFMAAGVPAVLGTLPGADENAARDLMIGFHREMSKGVSAEQALYTVQRNAIQENGRRLGAWTALVLYGSDR